MATREARIPPGPRGHWLWGSTVDFQSDQLGFVDHLTRAYGDVARFNVAFQPWVIISDPQMVYDITVRNHEKYLKPKINKRIFKDFLGEGVLSIDGASYKRQHKLMLPAFHKKRIDAYGQCMADYTRDMIDGWRSGQRVDFCGEMTELTLGIVAKTLFDSDVRGKDAETVREAMTTINEVLIDHINLPIPVPRWWPSATNKRKLAAIKNIDDIVQRIVDERRRTGEDRGDLLSMLVLAKEEGGDRLTDREIRDEAMTLFFAGHETTAHALTWCWYLLGKNPQVAEKLREEVDAVLGERAPTVSDLGSLPYTDMVFKEAMRMLPSVWVFMREPADDVELNGYLLKKGDTIFISPYVMHNNPKYFPEPHEFRPERFTKENERKLPKGAYLPFSMGQRVCMGKSFALMEARLILACLAQRVIPQNLPDYEPEMNPRLSLNPKNGLPIDVRLRSDPLVQAAE